MNIRLKYYGKVNGGSMKIYRRNDFLKDIEQFEGMDVVLTVEKKKKGRSLEQNAYYWGIVVPMVREGLREAGWEIGTNSEAHELMKRMFLKQEVVNKETGETMETTGSTTKCSTVDMMEYFADIQKWASEFLGLYIPDPNEQVSIEFSN